MRQGQSKEVARRAYQAMSDGLGSGDLSAVDEFVAADVRDHNPDPAQEQGLEGLKRFFLSLKQAFPDLQITVEDLIAEGDKVVGRVRFQGTHREDFQRIPATGKQFDMQVIEVLRIRDGKIRERWGVADQMGMMQQLGVIPA